MDNETQDLQGTQDLSQPMPDSAPASLSEGSQKPEAEKTYSRDEVNKMIAAEKRKASDAARSKAVAEWQRLQDEAQQRQTEAEKFSKMQADEQVKALQEKLERLEREKAEIQLQREADQLKQLAVEKAAASKLPLAFINDLDYKGIKAEELDDLIKERQEAFNAEVERRINEARKQSPPETHAPADSDPDAWKPLPQQGTRNHWEKYTRR